MRRYKLCLIGGKNVGKTALFIQFTLSHFAEEYDPIPQDYGDYIKQTILDDEVASLDISEAVSEASSQRYTEYIIRESDGFMLVYSITSRGSFEKIPELHQDILRIRDNVPILLVANKCDLAIERQVSTQEGRQLAERLGCHMFEASAKLEINVDNSFKCLARKIRDSGIETQSQRKNSRLSRFRKSLGCTIF
ncbi:Ras GTPase [Mortierella sp. AM989]|nr:Ras GTPase [Mortierella sp. AM989]